MHAREVLCPGYTLFKGGIGEINTLGEERQASGKDYTSPGQLLSDEVQPTGRARPRSSGLQETPAQRDSFLHLRGTWRESHTEPEVVWKRKHQTGAGLKKHSMRMLFVSLLIPHPYSPAVCSFVSGGFYSE